MSEISKSFFSLLNILSSAKTKPSSLKVKNREFLCFVPCLTGIGNHVLTFHFLFKYIGRKFPNAKFILLTRHKFFFPKLKAYENAENIKIVKLPTNIIRKFLCIVKLAVSGIDVAVNLYPCYRIKDLLLNLIAFIPIRIIHDGFPAQWPGLRKFYTHRIPFDPQQHDFVNNLRLFELIDAGLQKYEDKVNQELGVNTHILDIAHPMNTEHWKIEAESLQRKNKIAFHVGCSRDKLEKRWLPQNFFKLASLILEMDENIEIQLLGVNEDLNDEWHEKFNQLPNVNSLLSKIPLSEIMKTLQGSALLVSNDSALAHMAGKLNLPTIVLFGPTSPIQVCPIGENTICVENRTLCEGCFLKGRYYVCCNNNKCLNELPPEKIMELIKELYYINLVKIC